MTPEVQITAVQSFVAQAQGQRRGIWVKPYDQFFIEAKRWGLGYRIVKGHPCEFFCHAISGIFFVFANVKLV